MEKEISGICNKLTNLTIRDSYRRHLHRLKSSSSSSTSQIYHQLKRKASVQQGTRKQNSVKAQQLQQDASITEEKYLEKLILERKDYDETARFIAKSVRMRITKEDTDVLSTAYENFIRVSRKQLNVIRSIRQGGTEIIDLHIINNHRSKIVKELSDVCDKVSNMTIKQAYLHHLHEFKTHANPKTHTQSFINQEETPEIFFEVKGGLRSGRSNSPNRITKKPHIYEDMEDDDEDEDEDDDEDEDEDHCKCYEEELESKFPRFGRIGNWDPIYEGMGADLLHTPIKIQ
uniref:anaphase-promoting complex subunit 6-like n=1 Tax=Erigeron canadensis TaxID=72917 RepID=UPI001CB92226|nr:anaphase-promoting complex subunit 6-like [Erigeron canadensis]